MKRSRPVLVLVLALAGGCGIVDGLEVVPKPDAASEADTDSAALPDSSPDAGPVADPCKAVHPPAPNPSATSAASDPVTIVAVAKDISFGLPPDGGSSLEAISFDLDNDCACPRRPSCKPNKQALPRGCDDAGGQENAGQDVLAKASFLSPEKFAFQAFANESVRQGLRAILVVVRGYNGLADDSDVDVGVIVSPSLDPNGAASTPKWTTDDAWQIARSSVTLPTGGALVPVTNTSGYVVDHTIVVRLTIEVPVTEAAAVVLKDAKFTAKIIDGPDGTHTLGEIKFAGRWPIMKVTQFVGSFEPETGKGRLCDRTDAVGTFDTLKREVCGAADLRANEAEDGRDLPCDAVSFAVKAMGAPARLGDLKDVPTADYCSSASIDCTK